jgi:UDPglucose--hexose-1-phosphate uridylyltransferase
MPFASDADELASLPALAARTEPARGLVVEPASGQRVLLATHRDALGREREQRGRPLSGPPRDATGAVGRRAQETSAALPDLGEARCPFCPGHEADAEPTVARHPTTGPWRVRVVGNRFPLVGATASVADDRAKAAAEDGRIPGAHELVIETPAHDDDLDAQGEAHVADVLGMVAARLRVLRARPDAAAVFVFRNRGRAAGSSQPHPHAQIVTLPEVPPDLARRSARARAHVEATGTRLSDALRDAERRAGLRLVTVLAGAVSFCPRVSRRPYETWIVPTDASASLAEAPAEVVRDVATALVDAVSRLRALGLADAYNVLLRDPAVTPAGDESRRRRTPAAGSRPGSTFPSETSDGGWWFEVVPRTTVGAGFELGSGVDVLTVAPETAAEALRTIHRIATGAPGAL